MICEDYRTIKISAINFQTVTGTISIPVAEKVNEAGVEIDNIIVVISSATTLIGKDTRISGFCSIYIICRVGNGIFCCRLGSGCGITNNGAIGVYDS